MLSTRRRNEGFPPSNMAPTLCFRCKGFLSSSTAQTQLVRFEASVGTTWQCATGSCAFDETPQRRLPPSNTAPTLCFRCKGFPPSNTAPTQLVRLEASVGPTCFCGTGSSVSQQCKNEWIEVFLIQAKRVMKVLFKPSGSEIWDYSCLSQTAHFRLCSYCLTFFVQLICFAMFRFSNKIFVFRKSHLIFSFWALGCSFSFFDFYYIYFTRNTRALKRALCFFSGPDLFSL